MYEFHGWVTVQHGTGDDDERETRRAAELIRARTDDLATGPGVADLRWVNGVRTPTSPRSFRRSKTRDRHVMP